MNDINENDDMSIDEYSEDLEQSRQEDDDNLYSSHDDKPDTFSTRL